MNVSRSLVFLAKSSISEPMEEYKILMSILKKGTQAISNRKESHLSYSLVECLSRVKS